MEEKLKEIRIVRKSIFMSDEILRGYEGKDVDDYKIPDIGEKIYVKDYFDQIWKLKVKDIIVLDKGEALEILCTGHRI